MKTLSTVAISGLLVLNFVGCAGKNKVEAPAKPVAKACSQELTSNFKDLLITSNDLKLEKEKLKKRKSTHSSETRIEDLVADIEYYAMIVSEENNRMVDELQKEIDTLNNIPMKDMDGKKDAEKLVLKPEDKKCILGDEFAKNEKVTKIYSDMIKEMYPVLEDKKNVDNEKVIAQFRKDIFRSEYLEKVKDFEKENQNKK